MTRFPRLHALPVGGPPDPCEKPKAEIAARRKAHLPTRSLLERLKAERNAQLAGCAQ